MDAKQKDALELLAQGREAVLATLEENRPFTSSVNYLYLPQENHMKPFFLMSDMARHAKNVKVCPLVSLQVVERADAPLYQRKRVSVQGSLVKVSDSKISENYRTAYLSAFPEAKVFFTLADFHFYELAVTEFYFIGGFGKIESFK